MAEQIYTQQAETALRLAAETAEKNNHGYIGTEHILVGLLQEGKGTAAMILSEAGISADKVLTLIQELISPGASGTTVFLPEYTPKAKNVLKDAASEAFRFHTGKIGTEHILIALLKEPECAATRLLYTMEADVLKIQEDLIDAMGLEPEEAGRIADENRTDYSGMPMLDRYSRDLTKLAGEGKLDPVIGREPEIERIIQILSRRTKNNPCLIGEPGVGKTAIVEGLAEKIVNGEVPDTMLGKRVLVLDLAGMVAGSKYRGEFEERIKRVIREAADHSNVLLFVDEIHTMIGAGGAEGAMDASNILKPSLSRGEIQLIGATTREEYRKYIEKDAALERRFQPVSVEEPTEEQTIEILKELRPYYEKHHGVSITDEALKAAVKMSVRYINDRFLPDKAIDLMDEASSMVRLSGYSAGKGANAAGGEAAGIRHQMEEAVRNQNAVEMKNLRSRLHELEKREANHSGMQGSHGKVKRVDEEAIAHTVSLWTKIPVDKLKESESRRLTSLEKILHKRVVGQEEAISAVAKAIRRGRVGLKDPRRPIGSFLFLGPTGVGKTELSKALAEAVFGSENNMIRVDMSEYMEKHSVSKLIGSPPGYVGYEEGGQLSEKIRRNPYSVLLFDEIEKAHPDVFNILLQVLDDGRITDAQGRTVSFKETIIIMTSNTGASDIIRPKHLGFASQEDAAEDYRRMKERVMEAVRQTFRPEFLNRIDDIIVFHMLTKEDMGRIIDIQLKELLQRCRDELDIRLSVTNSAKSFLIEKSYDQKFGARPLRREIQNQIENPLADRILSGEIKEGSTVQLRARDGKLVWKATDAA